MIGRVKVAVSRDGQLEASFSTASATWWLMTARSSVIVDEWQYVELSWHPDKGAYLHISKRRLSTGHSHTRSDARTHNRTSTVYIGSFDRPVNTAPASNKFQVLVDELSVWFADRDHVKAFGFLEDGK